MSTTFILIRHAEKLDWPTGMAPSLEAKRFYQDTHELSAKGFERAHALVGYFKYRPEIVNLFQERPLAAIVCQGVDPNGKGKSLRPLQTVRPLYDALTVTNTSITNSESRITGRLHYVSPLPLLQFVKKDMKVMANSLRTDPTYLNKSVIICWSHAQLPKLALHLLADWSNNAMIPDEWPRNMRFDVTWVLQNQKLTQLPQRLMLGDEQEILGNEGANTENDDDED